MRTPLHCWLHRPSLHPTGYACTT